MIQIKSMVIFSLIIMLVLIFFGVRLLQKDSFLYLKIFRVDNPKAFIIFMHGGPGFSSTPHEADMRKLSNLLNSDIVIYDRQGEGLSDRSGNYQFSTSLAEVKYIIQKYSRSDRKYIIGFSFGGNIALRAQNLGLVNGTLLVSVPVNYKQSILNANNLSDKKNIPKNKYNINIKPFEYTTYTFSRIHWANDIKLLDTRRFQEAIVSSKNRLAFYKFFKNESLLEINDYSKVKANSKNLRYIAGKHDWILSENDLIILKNILGNQFRLVDGFHYSAIQNIELLKNEMEKLIRDTSIN